MAQVKYRSGVSDGATAIGHELDTVNSLVTQGAKLLSVKNAGVEKFAVDKDGNTTTPLIRTVKPSEGVTGINAALNALQPLGGGIVQLLAGTYIVDSPITHTSYAYINNVTIQGMGDATILDVQSGAGFPSAAIELAGWIRLGGSPLNNVTVGDASVYKTDPSYADYVEAGDAVWIVGYTDGAYPDIRYYDAELHFASGTGNNITGEIPLVEPVLKTMTNCIIYAFRGGFNNCIRDLKVRYSSGTSVTHAVRLGLTYNSLVENVTVIGFNSYETIGIQVQGFYNKVNNCRVTQMAGAALDTWGQYNLISNNFFSNVRLTDSYYSGAVPCQGSYDCIFRKNEISNVLGCGFTTGYGSGSYGLRDTYEENSFFNVKYTNINHGSTGGHKILNNKFDTGTDLNAIDVGNGRDIIISGNTIKNFPQGLRFQNANSRNYVVTDNYFENITTYDCISIQEGSKNHVVSGNIMKDCVYGITVAADECVITNNLVEDASIGIYISGSKHVISENSVRTVSSIGITLDALSTNNTLVGNNCLGAGITNNGANNDLIGNKE